MSQAYRNEYSEILIRAEVHYSIIRPDSFGEKWNLRLQITPVIKSPFM